MGPSEIDEVVGHPDAVEAQFLDLLPAPQFLLSGNVLNRDDAKPKPQPRPPPSTKALQQKSVTHTPPPFRRVDEKRRRRPFNHEEPQKPPEETTKPVKKRQGNR
jgi:hypothetical protein